MFITEDKRVGSYYLEFQYCKTDSPIKHNKIDIDNIKHWEYDSLLINADEFNGFYKLYSDIFNCALLANGEIGFDSCGINYYDKKTSENILQKLNVVNDEYNNLILWLQKAVENFKGFYILGI